MKIASTDVAMSVAHKHQESLEQREVLQYRDQEKEVAIERHGIRLSLSAMAEQIASTHGADIGELPQNSLAPGFQRRMLSPPQAFMQSTSTQLMAPLSQEDTNEFMKSLEELQLKLLEKMLEKLFGIKMDLKSVDLDDIQDVEPLNTQDPNAAEGAAGASEGSDFSLFYRYDERYEEHERLDFRAQAQIKTESGDVVNIDLSMHLSRHFIAENHLEIRAGQALKDPLVVNYAGNPAELTEKNFEFDIDADGELDLVSFVKPGSGFLALDKNENGRIDNGLELFGAKTGDGFAELAVYDEDGNGAIDEGDTVFKRLKIMVRDIQGDLQLMSMQALDIGAILLDHAETPFQYKNEHGELMGLARSTGIALREDYTAITVQQIDLAV